MLRACVAVANAGANSLDVVNRNAVCFEQQWLARRQTRGDQIPDNFLLPVNHHRAARQILEVNPMAMPAETQKDAVMKQTLAHHALAYAHLVQYVNGLMFQNAGAHPALDVLTALGLQHDGLDAAQVQEVREQQSGRTGANNCNLGAHGDPRSSLWRAKL